MINASQDYVLKCHEFFYLHTAAYNAHRVTCVLDLLGTSVDMIKIQNLSKNASLFRIATSVRGLLNIFQNNGSFQENGENFVMSFKIGLFEIVQEGLHL